MTARLQVVLLGFVIFTSIAIALHAFGFQLRLSGSPDFHVRFDAIPIPAAMHVLGSGLALLIGGFQFSQTLRRKYLHVHRWLGRIYLIMILIGGLGSFMLAPQAAGGLVAKIGFFLLAVLWWFSAFQAYVAVRRGDIAEHRAWMLRNFALTFAAVTLRIQLGTLTASGVPFEEAYPVVAWLSWVPNLVLIEWYLALSQRKAAATARGAPKGALSGN